MQKRCGLIKEIGFDTKMDLDEDVESDGFGFDIECTASGP